MKLKKLIVKVLCAAIGAAMVNTASAQQAIATWSVDGITSAQNGGGSPPANFVNNGGNVNLVISPMQKGFGFGLDSGLNKAYGGVDFTNPGVADSEANSIAAGYYITYAVQASPGYTVSFSTNVAYFHNSATGPWEGELQYSTDATHYSDIAPVSFSSGNVAATAYQAILMTNSILQNVPSSVTNYFRLVLWGATGTGGTWYIDGPNSATLTNSFPGNLVGGTTNEFVVFGQVTPIPQAIATWSVDGITSAQNGGGAPPANFSANSTTVGVITYPMQKGSGFGLDSGLNKAYGGVDFTNPGVADSEANSIADGYYITYAIQAATNYTISFSTNVAYFHNSATGPWEGELQYSTDAAHYSDIAPVPFSSGNVAATAYQATLVTNSFLQNVPTTTTNYFRLVIWGATGTGGTWYIDGPNSSTLTNSFPGNLVGGTTNEFAVFGTVTSLTGGTSPPPANTPPANVVVSPASQTVNAGQSATFTLTGNLGNPTGSNFWYVVVGSTTNPVSGQTSTTLTLPGAVGGNAGGYFAVVSNSQGSATSEVAQLTIANDPTIQASPNDTYGLVDGTVQFSVTAAATSPTYQWYFTDASGNVIGPVNNGSTTASGAVISGAGTSTISIANVQAVDPTNFIVVVSDIYGKQTSSVASLLEVTNVYYVDYVSPYNSLPPVTPIALWDFNGSEFTNTAINPTCIADPVPYIGVGTALPIGGANDPGTSPFSGSVDSADGPEFDSIIPSKGPHQPDFSWGTDNYPASGGNKQNGVQFNVSTVGAKNILLSYDSRVSATASDYERVQYTTNGNSWIDYPSSSTFGGVGTTYITYSNDFSGFPNVANNPNFGVRIVTEVQYTATYGISGSADTNAYFGTANTYGTAGTVTYDLVGIYGDAITNNNVAPVISSFMDTNTLDNKPITIPFTVSGDTTADKFTYSALSLNPSMVNPTFNFTSNALGNCTLTIMPATIQPSTAAAPILVSVTDTNGDVTKTWFLLTLISANLPPTNSLTQLAGTNTIANTTLAVPFQVGSARDSVTQFTYDTGSGNNTLVPAQNISVSGVGTANPTVTITPGSNELGMGSVMVTVHDNDLSESKSTTANVPFMVRPNTNILFVDYFNYDQSGFLDNVSTYWQHLTGTVHTMQLNSSPTGGYVLVDTANATENMEVPLLGAPYSTNAAAPINTLYYSMSINLNDPSDMPNSNGTYFAALNDGLPSATADVEALLMITTNDVAPGDFGDYQVGIADQVGATASSPSTKMFPQDLVPGNNYNVVVGLNLSNGVSTVWVNPSSESSPSVTSANSTTIYNISDFELRQSGNESGDIAGAVSVSYLKVGTTFDSVFPTLHVQQSGNNNVIVNWSDPTLGLQSTPDLLLPFTDIPSAQPPYTYSTTTNSTVFFRFGR